ncbi:MAG: type II toxin-antitoxin system RelE/ParE family toxin [Deltaproteobacteria bacterium]|nr:type II toxin-antitoxin system RelE/ParE family toxin [Deltaproteobacteria bacterium]
MAAFSVVLKPSVHRDLRGLPAGAVRRVWERIRALALDPLPAGTAKLAGADRLYRVRVGDYRVVYGFDPGLREVVVHYVRHRREAYR